MKYFIRTTGERSLDISYSQVNYELLIDKEHNNVKSFINQIKYLASLEEDCVILEDDLILCRNFKEEIEKVIGEHKNKVINFFYNPKSYVPRISEQLFFILMQCVYFPKDILKLLSENLESELKKRPNTQSDLLVYAVLGSRQISFLSSRPCLVQHLSFNTLIHYKTHILRTPYFKDYLDDLGLTYEEAKDNQDKLEEYMNGRFKEYEKINWLHTS